MNKIFQGGAVTLSFDDGYKTILRNAVPILQHAHFLATFYIITRTLHPKHFRYMNVSDLASLRSKNHEIGCHTVKHKNLTEQPEKIIFSEINDSKKCLEHNGFIVRTFAYPFGKYNEQVYEAVRAAGFLGSRIVNQQFVTDTTDPFLLDSFCVIQRTRVEEICLLINEAKAEHRWLILTFHNINYDNVDEYAVTPDFFAEIVSYLQRIRIPVIRVYDGILRLNQK